jgi:hypothetical protein
MGGCLSAGRCDATGQRKPAQAFTYDFFPIPGIGLFLGTRLDRISTLFLLMFVCNRFFCCADARFGALDGVLTTESGYCGGKAPLDSVHYENIQGLMQQACEP